MSMMSMCGRGGRASSTSAVIVVGLAILCGGLGWLIGNNRATPDPNSVDIGFLQDMRTHHEQAVTMGLYYLSPARHRPESASDRP